MQVKNYIEECNKKQREIILDTSSMNKICEDDDLSIRFFSKIQDIEGIVALPLNAFVEISIHKSTFNQFNKIYRQKNCLKIIIESTPKRIKREIDKPIESKLYLKKDVDLLIYINDESRKFNEEWKKIWKENCKQKREEFNKFFSIGSEERNKKMDRMLQRDKFLRVYREDQDFFVLDFFKNNLNIDFPKNKIYSDGNRYKFINLLQYLMYMNMLRSFLSGKKSKFAASKGDLFDMDIAAFSAYSSCFISEDRCLFQCLQKIKNNSEHIGFENKYKIYHTIENFCQDTF